jgi:phosphoribosylaminoimidazole-succinocarboxamide synthase
MGYDPSPLIEQTHLINDYLLNIFNLCGLDLIDFKIEYGIDPHGDLLLADEISPDCMRLWGKTDQERYDKDLFRMDEGDVIPAYKTILDKLQATFV